MKKRRAHGKQKPAPRTHAAKAEPQILRMEKPVYGGSFLARAEGKAIFVPLTLPGERVRARIVDDRRSFANAEAEEILEASPERVAAECRHFAACGGCHYQHTGYAQQLNFKKAILIETLERAGVEGIPEIQLLRGEPWRYRNRIRLAVDASGQVGYRGRRSHTIVPIAECPVAADVLVRAALAFGDVARAYDRPLQFDEVTVFCTPDELQVLGWATVRKGSAADLNKFAEEWSARVPQLCGITFHAAEQEGLPPRLLAEWGQPSIAYPVHGSVYRVDAGAFFQVNRWLADELVQAATHGAPGELAWDLYAGVGLFAKQLAATFNRVKAVEAAPQAEAALAANLAGTCGTALREETLSYARRMAGDRPDWIVVDPPRTGLGPAITAQLGEIRAAHMSYVSCDPATLARDLRALAACGYAIESLTLADLFPQTFHLETVARLRQK